MVFRKNALFGSSEEHINYRAVASFRIKNGIFLSNVCIETSGGESANFRERVMEVRSQRTPGHDSRIPKARRIVIFTL